MRNPQYIHNSVLLNVYEIAYKGSICAQALFQCAYFASSSAIQQQTQPFIKA